MDLDAQLLLSSAQAITASARSSNVLDLGAARDIGNGRPMAVLIHTDVAADFTTGDETYDFTIQTDTDVAFGTAVDLITHRLVAAERAINKLIEIPVPAGATVSRYLCLYATLAGTTPSITFSAWLVEQGSIPNLRKFANGAAIL